jgi:hypothetical protein
MTLKCPLFYTSLLAFIFLSTQCPLHLHAQEPSQETKEVSGAESAEPTEPAETAGTNEAAGDAEDLVQKTLGNDINTASYYELVSWCRDLGLDDTGTRQALQQRLYAFYGISAPPVETAPEGKSRLLEIKSAKETQYFTIEQVDEDYVLLLGDVLVEIKEEEATHRIRAHRILLNETENILSAEGGIEYTLIKGTEEEVFRGQRLTFNVDSWEGVFFSGGMEADRTIGGESIRFHFTGESISRLEGNTVVINRGQITSCDLEEDPHYHIRARKIWVLAPNEWAILNAVLYVGRVPLLYLPFFFRPGDEFFFHPAIGYRDPEGQFIQTTTYLIGQKKRSSSALSFLAATEESTTQYEVQREGLFLRPNPDKPIVIDEDRFLKVMLDLYSRLGVFAGMEASFPKVDFKGGVARSIMMYGLAPETNRFGFESSWNLGNAPNSFTGNFEYFSDPTFPEDFYNRAEETGLTRIMGIEPIEEATTAEEKQTLTWEMRAKLDFSDKFDTPLVKTLSFPYITANVLWEDVEGDYNPTILKLPSASFQMLGNLLDITRPSAKGSTRTAGKTSPVPADLRPPWEQQVEVQAPPEAPPEVGHPLPYLRPPEPKESEAVSLQKTPLQFELNYQFRPSADLEQNFNRTNSEPYYSELDTRGTFSLDHKLRILENVLTWSGNVSVVGNYRHYNNQSLPTDKWDNLVLNQQQNTQVNFKFSQGLDYFPFADDPIFGNTSLSYDVGSTFYRYYDKDSLTTGVDYSGQLIQWSDEWFSVHSAQSALRWKMFGKENSLSLSAQLPPRSGSFTANLQYKIWLLTTTVNSVFQDSDAAVGAWGDFGDWSFQPVVFRETLDLADNLSLSEELRFDVTEPSGSGLLAKSVTSLNLWDLSGSFNMDYSKPQEFDKDANSWTDAPGEESLRPSYITLSYNPVGEERLYWKNRIRLSTSIDASWSMNILQFTDNSLDFSLTFDFWLYRFLKLSLTTSSYNNRTFLYFPKLAEKLGQAPVNPIEDLINSFNFFDREARELSGFNLRGIKVEAVHYLHDWNLSLSYEGKPYLMEEDNEYQWRSNFSVILQWQPIPELRSHLKREWDDEEDVYDSSLRG